MPSHVENLSLFALIYLAPVAWRRSLRWESFIIRLDILRLIARTYGSPLRIFHYSPWYTYYVARKRYKLVENLSLFALIYLELSFICPPSCWESFIIRLDILSHRRRSYRRLLRIFHYSPWYTYTKTAQQPKHVENLSLFALIYLYSRTNPKQQSWESFIIRLDILTLYAGTVCGVLRIFHYSPWYT